MPWEEMAFGLTVFVSAAGVMTGMIAIIIRASRRARGGASTERLDERLTELNAGLARLSGVEDRLTELEERLDFAERVLGQIREPERLPPQRGT